MTQPKRPRRRKSASTVDAGQPTDFFGNPIAAGDIIAVRQNVGKFQMMGRRRVVEVHAGGAEPHVVHEHMDGGKAKRLLKTKACFLDLRTKYHEVIKDAPYASQS